MKKNCMQPEYKELRHKLEYFRKKNDLTQSEVVAQLATKYGIYVDRSAISHWESGTEPSFKILCALKDIYKVKLEDFEPGFLIEGEKVSNEEHESKSNDNPERTIEQFKNAMREDVLEHCRKYFDTHKNMFAKSGSYLFDVDLMLDILDGFELEYMPIVAQGLKELGYTVMSAEVTDSNWCRIGFIVILLGGESFGRWFERDLSDILASIMCNSGVFSNSDEPNGLFKRARKIHEDRGLEIDKLYDEVFGEAKYVYNYEDSDGNDYTVGCADKAELFATLDIIRPKTFELDGVWYYVKNSELESFKSAFTREMPPSIIVKWASEDGEEGGDVIETDQGSKFYEHEADFAYNLAELLDILKKQKRKYACVEIDDNMQDKDGEGVSRLYADINGKLLTADAIMALEKIAENLKEEQ